MPAPFSKLSDEEKEKLKDGQKAAFAKPMLATLTHDHFSDPDWIYERKLDGERALALRRGKTVKLLSRNEKDISGSYPEIIEALEKQPKKDFLMDGEIVAFDGNVSSFSKLQKRMQVKDPEKARNTGVAVYFYAFDLITYDGKGLEAVPLRGRKRVLKAAFDFDNKFRYTAHRNENGEAYLKEACEKGWEGLIAKKADSQYRHTRSKDWLKFKCQKGQELVIAGFTDPKGSRKGFGALLVGYYDDGDLKYAGKVGTGYDDELLVDLRARMDKLERDSAPFDDEVKEKNVHFITPKLVGEFGFTEWTKDGRLRHPRFLGLRRDKKARDVVREDTS